MNTTPFLQQVARYYATNVALNELCDYAFVLPNRRSAQQLDTCFRQELHADVLTPAFITINDLVDRIVRGNDNGLVTASTIETLFVLYEAYTQVMGDDALEGGFDKFAHWGDILVNDFNDVDMNLVDAGQLFSNLRDLKEIKTDYIDEELKSAIGSILSIHLRDKGAGRDNMWTREIKPGSVKKQFFTLWDKLYDIYETYGEKLQEYGLTTQGKLYRLAAQVVKDVDASHLGYEHIVMVGHDVLTVSEIAIFTAFGKKGVAQFWWDNASPALLNEANPAQSIMRELSSKFPSPVPIDKIESWPQVTVEHVPSVVGMAKCAFENIEDVRNDIAIVLPDETLLEPLLNSLPDALIDDYVANNPGVTSSDVVNITMGYSLRRSNIASLMRLVTIAHKHATWTAGEWKYYREDVRNILSHPILKMVYTREVLNLNNKIEAQREFNIPGSQFAGTALEPLFRSLRQYEMSDKGSVITFIENLRQFCCELDGRLKGQTAVITDDTSTTLSLQRAFIRLYMGALDQLIIAIDHVGLPVSDDTIFHLIDRAAASAMIPFGGMAGNGVQVMGLLETRCLDFDDLRILSANEGTLPPRNNVQSFIPNRFRAAFNMPTIELSEAAQTYRFYRLVSRAGVITLYRNTPDDTEPSRFIEQMARVYGIDVHHVTRTASINITHAKLITIDSDSLRRRIFSKYTTGDAATAPCLSASSIKEYLKCPLKFYFHHIQGLSDDNEASDFMDSGEFGTIVHDTLQELYYPTLSPGVARKREFNKGDIENFRKNGLDTALTRQINKTFNHKGEDNHDALTGQGIILKQTLRTYVERALDIDCAAIADNGSLEVVECETQHPLKLRLTDEVSVNFTFKADRIDRIGSTLRIIDYKTGKDDVKFNAVEELFTEKSHNKQVVLQLLLYCMSYVQLGQVPRGITHIQPVVYKLSASHDNVGVKMGRGKGKEQLTIPVQDFLNHPVVSTFAIEMTKHLKPLWTSPIAQTTDSENCKYCNFKDFCRR